ncbi:MAG: YIP1 family protein [Anaerolineae bacterium]|nr:MAG: YIP1 family protein [Anaerolineae bacterium]
MVKKLLWMLREPAEFFEAVRTEGYREPLVFLSQVSAVIAVFTPVVNYLGWPSTDRTSTYQAQILAWRITSEELLPRLGGWAYVVEAPLILALSLIIALFLAGFLHLIYRLLGGQGPILNAWKATCYGVGPCVLLGWVAYWTLFVGAWSFVLQLYYGPKVLYRMPEGRALLILAGLVGATLLEFATKGTTVGF